MILVTGYQDRDSWSADMLQPTSGRAMVLPGDAVAQPQTAADAVADLHELLHAAVIPAPYVLVGHSCGGQVFRLHASVFSTDVAGLVLVDALPAVEQRLTLAERAAYQQLLTGRPAELATYQDLETVDFVTSAIQVQEAAPLHPLPLVVLSRSQRSHRSFRRAFRWRPWNRRGPRVRLTWSIWCRTPGT